MCHACMHASPAVDALAVVMQLQAGHAWAAQTGAAASMLSEQTGIEG